jgi:hypothetical protein
MDNLISGNFIAPVKLLSALLLSFSQRRIALLDINNCGLPHFGAEEIPVLNHKIAAPMNLFAVVTLHSLLKSEAVFGDGCFLAVGVWETAVGVSEPIGFVSGFFGQLV